LASQKLDLILTWFGFLERGLVVSYRATGFSAYITLATILGGGSGAVDKLGDGVCYAFHPRLCR